MISFLYFLCGLGMISGIFENVTGICVWGVCGMARTMSVEYIMSLPVCEGCEHNLEGCEREFGGAALSNPTGNHFRLRT